MGNFTRKHRWKVVMAFVLTVLSQLVQAQSGSTGSTFVHSGGEMGIFGQHNFQNGSGTISAGIIGSERQPAIGVYSFVNPSGSWVGASDQAFVDGYVRTYNTSAFTFPIGDNGKYRPAAVSASASSAPTTAAYYGVDPGTATTSDLKGGTYGVLPGGGAAFSTTSKGTDVGTVDNVEYWDIDGTTPARITLTWDATTPISAMVGTDLSRLKIVGWDGTQWVIIPSTVDAGSLVLNASASAFTGPAGTVIAGSITTDAGVVPGTYTVYTLAGNNVNLPCSLTVTASASQTAVCPGNSVNLSASISPAGSYTYTWSGSNAFTSDQQNPTVTNIQPGADGGDALYTVIVTGVNGCSGTATVPVSVSNCCAVPAPTASVTTQPSCSTPTATITVTAPLTGVTYSFDGGLTFQTSNVKSGLAANTNYQIVVRDNTGCVSEPSLLTVNPAGNLRATATSNSPICSGNVLELSASSTGGTGTVSYNWTGPNGFASTLQNPSIASPTAASGGVYTVTVSDPTCSTTASTTVTIATQPDLAISGAPSLTLCSGQSAVLSVAGDNGASVTWMNTLGQTGTGTTINFPGLLNVSGQPQTITYYFTASAGGCSDAATASVTINPAPVLRVVPTQAIICALELTNVNATATPATATINWTRTPGAPAPASGNGTGELTINESLPAGAYSYTFTATNDGCTSAPVTVSLVVNN